MSADGALHRLEERLQRVEPATFEPPPPEAPPELKPIPPKRYEPRIESYRDAPSNLARRRAILVMVGLLLFGGVGVGVLMAYRPNLEVLFPSVNKVTNELDSALGVEKGTLLVTSEPSGATVRVENVVVGTTPWAGDNVWKGTVTVTVTHEGYRTWTATFKGGGPRKLEARLRSK